MNMINWLEKWKNQFPEDVCRIKIQTLDNPGWIVEINLENTGFEIKEFEKVSFDNSDDDWIICNVEDNGTHSKDKDDDTDLYKLYGLKWPNRKYNDCNVFIEHKKFIGKGDQFKLEMILKIFKNWAETGEY